MFLEAGHFTKIPTSPLQISHQRKSPFSYMMGAYDSSPFVISGMSCETCCCLCGARLPGDVTQVPRGKHVDIYYCLIIRGPQYRHVSQRLSQISSKPVPSIFQT